MLYRGSTNISEKHDVPLVQQSDNVIIVSSTYKLRNNSRIESTSGWSNSNPTFTPVKNDSQHNYRSQCSSNAQYQAQPSAKERSWDSRFASWNKKQIWVVV